MLKTRVKMRDQGKGNRLNYREEKALTSVGAFFCYPDRKHHAWINQKGVNMLRYSLIYSRVLNRKSNLKTSTGIGKITAL